MKVLFAIAIVMLASSTSFAAQENRGTEYCRSAFITCQSEDREVVACVFSHRTSVIKNGVIHEFETAQVPIYRDALGAGLTYKGNGITLNIATGTYPSNEGLLSYLSVRSLHLQDEVLLCELDEMERN